MSTPSAGPGSGKVKNLHEVFEKRANDEAGTKKRDAVSREIKVDWSSVKNRYESKGDANAAVKQGFVSAGAKTPQGNLNKGASGNLARSLDSSAGSNAPSTPPAASGANGGTPVSPLSLSGSGAPTKTAPAPAGFSIVVVVVVAREIGTLTLW
jgi:hypothetical protein